MSMTGTRCRGDWEIGLIKDMENENDDAERESDVNSP